MRVSTRKKIGDGVCIVCMTIVLIVILFPILWALPAMFKGRSEIFELPLHWLPHTWTVANFKTIFSMTVNNYLMSIASTTLVAVVSDSVESLGQYDGGLCVCTYRVPGKKFFWVYMLSTMFIPGITILLTSVRVVTALKMLDTIWVLIIPGVASGYNVFFFRQYFYGVPKYMEEAAMIDGLSKAGIFFRIYPRISTAPMVICGMSVFMGYYNSFCGRS